MSQDNASQNIPVNASDETPVSASEDAKEQVLEPEIMTEEEIAAQDAEAAEAEIEAENAESEDVQSTESAENAETTEDSKPDEASQNDAAADAEQENQPKEPDWKDAYIRLRADFDNYRKRTSKEFDDVRRRERERVVGIWLDVYDNAERALASMAEKSGPWYEGFASLIQQMNKCLATLNIKPVEDIGEKFDPKRHEAIATMQDPTKENNTILFVERKGFVYDNGDIARVARVIVVKNPS